MILHLDNMTLPMKLVYQLSKELENDPQQVALAQDLSLDVSRPEMGLRGRHGLFGSPQWWQSVCNGVMPLRRVSGVIRRVYPAGQDASPEDNAFDLVTTDGETVTESCYVNYEEDVSLFKVGHRVEILYALDELKAQPGPDGKVNVSEIVLEMAVSQAPALQEV